MRNTLLCSLSFILALSVDAAEDFRRVDGDTHTELIYNWPDQGIRFQVNNTDLPHKQSLPRYSAERMKLHVRNQLILKAAALQQPGLRIKFSPANLPLEVQVEGKDPKQVEQVLAALNKAQQEAQQKNLTANYFYSLKLPTGERVVIPDHGQFFTESLAPLKPVAAAFTAQYGDSNIRQIANKIALWVQRIPYQDLSNRQESAGDGYSPPLRVLLDHRGDCDSKAVLFAAVMKNIFPKLNLQIIYFRDHAIIGAKIPPLTGELTVDIAGVTYLLIDPTGPAQLAIGQLSEEYAQAISNNHFTSRPL